VWTYFLVMCLLRKALSFCVAGDWIESLGETYCCVLHDISVRYHKGSYRNGAIHLSSSLRRDANSWRWASRLLG
jgi:hypothetical protein